MPRTGSVGGTLAQTASRPSSPKISSFLNTVGERKVKKKYVWLIHLDVQLGEYVESFGLPKQCQDSTNIFLRSIVIDRQAGL